MPKPIFNSNTGQFEDLSVNNPMPSALVGLDANGQDVDVTRLPSLPAGENHAANVGGEGDLIDVVLTLDTLAYADGDLLADTQVVTNALRKIDGTGVLQSVELIDEDDQGIALDLVFLQANVSLGAENAAPTVTDANMRNSMGRVRVEAGDYVDWGGVRTATKTGVGLFLKAAAGTRDVYVAAIIRGAGTYTANGIRLRLGILQN